MEQKNGGKARLDKWKEEEEEEGEKEEERLYRARRSTRFACSPLSAGSPHKREH